MNDKAKCKDLMDCQESECPAYNGDNCCWLIDGTLCHGTVQGNFLSKVEMCLACPVFKSNMNPGAMEASCAMMARQFRDAREKLHDRDRELESISMEMAIGLSEAFEALKKIGAGDPEVRLDEGSSLELIVKLKQMVNRTAKHMGEMVDMTHEFAMGLAEHFDVLHRVGKGDLAARVQGESSVELLNALKAVTNRMIDDVKHEIDNRHKAARDLAVSEERFRTFAENAPIGITIMSPDLTFAFINRTFTEIFGYTIEDIPDKTTWFNKAYPDQAYRRKAVDVWESYRGVKAKIGEVRPITLQVCCKNGSKKTISFRTVVMASGNHFVTYADISQEARAQRILKESEEKYRTLIDNIQDGVILVENERFVFVNEAMARMIGYTAAEMIGMAFIGFIFPEDRDLVMKRYRRRRAGVTVPNNYEIRLLKKGGTLLYVNINMGTINYHHQVLTIGTVKDITELKRAEAERRAMAEKLERSKKMEAIGTLAGGVAHDLNNILSGIVSYPELLLMDLPADSPLKGPIETIQKSGQRAAAIVQDLLTLARRGVASKEAVDLNLVVSEYLNSPEFAKLCSYHPLVTVEKRLTRDMLTISGSPAHLSKTVMNLVSNAAEAISEAGGTITICTENRYVDRSLGTYEAVAEGEYAVLTVADTGVGISPNNIQRIFEPFYTKKIMGRSGTGLGMAVVWGTVKDHGGYVDVKSNEGEGTTLTLYFPIARDLAIPDAEPATLESFYGAGQRILVVDDVPEQRNIATAILERLGYRVAAVPSGEAAVDHISNHNVDLVILDMIMDPGIDGLETYRRMAAVKPDVKAIVASGFSETERVKNLNRLGVHEYLKKPYTIEKIGLAVKRTLGG